MILLITNKADITTDFIVNGLNKKGCEYYRFNTEDVGSRAYVNLDLSRDKYILWDSIKKREIDLPKIKSVYFRRPKLPSIEEKGMSPGELKFTQGEHYYTLEGIYKILADKYWINDIYAIREAENKVFQLRLAKQIGFEIPESIVTSIPEKASRFIDFHEECIVKPLKTGLIEDTNSQKYIFTTQLTKNDIFPLERIKYCPTLIQRKIDKAYDIRVTVVGDKIFPARINSQVYEETKVDWRRGDRIDLRYDILELHRSINEMCILLTKSLKLHFSAIDLVMDNNGKIFFLEINPNGQWAWIEKRLGYDISGEIINLLKMGGHEDTKNC
jgi:hypothetical protein